MDPCTDFLDDKAYLKHMIPHHQVAIDMSELLMVKTSNPFMLHLCRDIIRKQGYEIWEMELMMKSLPGEVFVESESQRETVDTKLSYYEPVMSLPEAGGCDPLFFDPEAHEKHMEHMPITDRSYLEHMIPHHQVAIDMSRRLLKHTKNSYLLDFCRKLIYDQQNEIFLMNNLLKENYEYKSTYLHL